MAINKNDFMQAVENRISEIEREALINGDKNPEIAASIMAGAADKKEEFLLGIVRDFASGMSNDKVATNRDLKL